MTIYSSYVYCWEFAQWLQNLVEDILTFLWGRQISLACGRSWQVILQVEKRSLHVWCKMNQPLVTPPLTKQMSLSMIGSLVTHDCAVCIAILLSIGRCVPLFAWRRRGQALSGIFSRACLNYNLNARVSAMQVRQTSCSSMHFKCMLQYSSTTVLGRDGDGGVAVGGGGGDVDLWWDIIRLLCMIL